MKNVRRHQNSNVGLSSISATSVVQSLYQNWLTPLEAQEFVKLVKFTKFTSVPGPNPGFCQGPPWSPTSSLNNLTWRNNCLVRPIGTLELPAPVVPTHILAVKWSFLLCATSVASGFSTYAHDEHALTDKLVPFFAPSGTHSFSQVELECIQGRVDAHMLILDSPRCNVFQFFGRFIWNEKDIKTTRLNLYTERSNSCTISVLREKQRALWALQMPGEIACSRSFKQACNDLMCSWQTTEKFPLSMAIQIDVGTGYK